MITVLTGFGFGMRSSHDFILGVSDDETVMLDMDDTCFQTVLYWANRTMNWHNLEGFIILRSSPGCYHVVFDRRVDWSENMRVVAWVAQLSRNEELQRWHRMQCIKMKSTLRFGPKGEKPSPTIVKKVGNQNDRICKFLMKRKEILSIINNKFKNLLTL